MKVILLTASRYSEYLFLIFLFTIVLIFNIVNKVKKKKALGLNKTNENNFAIDYQKILKKMILKCISSC